MSAASIRERYLRLGLRIGRHVDGIVDAYFGPPEYAAQAAAEDPVAPETLVADAQALLDEIGDGWLRDQVVGLRTYAGVLAGESGSYADEVEGCYGVRPVHTDEAVFEAAHARLDELLPGDGTVAERYERWRASMAVPAERVREIAVAAIEQTRALTRDLVELPAGEGVVVDVVHDKPWLAFNHYLGDLQSRIEINADLPISAVELLRLVIHEGYPGHHAERALKEHLLVRGRGLLEETLVLLPTPQSLVSEGIAETAPQMLLAGAGGASLAGVMHAAGIELDLPHALAVQRAAEPSVWAQVNVAIMLHEAGTGEDEAHAYLQRWALMTPELASHLIRFLKEPTSRSYMITYAAGEGLCRAYVADRPERFRRLLTEQVRVGELLAARDAAP